MPGAAERSNAREIAQAGFARRDNLKAKLF
jgi:hypothetical protein